MGLVETKIEFLNHASVLIHCADAMILSDPWYEGDAFHKGWNLIFQNDPSAIENMLKNVTHIWLSHEHPDHFSIKFFNDYDHIIKQKNIRILFQKTHDKRVLKFLSSKNFNVIEMEFNKPLKLSEHVKLTCIKDGFYDSGLLIQNKSEKILNLNDCEINTQERAKEVKKVTGEVDLLLTQFSFAAWKGGKKNKKWRQDAAQEKLKSIQLQLETFKPKYLIPFASFIYFSHSLNAYLNDSINTPIDVVEYFKNGDTEVIIMEPHCIFEHTYDETMRKSALEFWDNQYSNINVLTKNDYSEVSNKDIIASYSKYLSRIQKNNNVILMRILRKLLPIKVFTPVEIFLEDKNISVYFDCAKNDIQFIKKKNPMLAMSSESLQFIFQNSFGFDTLTVNGCFEEVTSGGFLVSTKTLAIENLNNLGMSISLRTLLNVRVIMLFLRRLYRVSRKLET
jgi:UDP-MurNAc hydroxylase